MLHRCLQITSCFRDIKGKPLGNSLSWIELSRDRCDLEWSNSWRQYAI